MFGAWRKSLVCCLDFLKFVAQLSLVRNFYAMSITRFAFSILSVVFVFVVGCTAPKSKVSQQTQEQLAKLIAQTDALAQRVYALEQTNAVLQREVRALQEPRAPRMHPMPEVPGGGHSQTNQVPHPFLTPLQSK
jgi:cell division protein FtsB